MKKTNLTWQEREGIFSKEVLCGEDIQKLMGCSVSTASKIIQDIKAVNDRLKIYGVVHIQDYIDYYRLDINRYMMNRKVRAYEEYEQ